MSPELNSSIVCPKPEPYDITRLLIIGCATPIAILAVPMNLLLFGILLSDRVARTSVKFYIAILAALDVYLALVYVFLFTVDAIAVNWEIGTLYTIYMSYMFPMLATCNIILFASKYILVCATIDRFIAVAPFMVSFRKLTNPKSRNIAVLGTFVLALLFRACTFWDYQVTEAHASCIHPLERWDTAMVLMDNSNTHYRTYNLYVLTIFGIFLPFTILLVLNGFTVYCLRKDIRDSYYNRKSARNPATSLTTMIHLAVKRSRLNTATYSMLALVTSYLICNSMDVFLKLCESFWLTQVFLNDDGSSNQFYILSTDLISVLFVLNCFLRLPLCYFCDSHVRVRCTRFLSCGKKHSHLSDKFAVNLERGPVPEVHMELLNDNGNSPKTRWKLAVSRSMNSLIKSNNNDAASL